MLIGAAELARLVGISRQKMSSSLSVCHARAKTWRGLEVVKVPGSAPGGHVYKVHVDSLPAELRERWKGLQGPVEGALEGHYPVPTATAATWDFVPSPHDHRRRDRLKLLRPVLAPAPGSRCGRWRSPTPRHGGASPRGRCVGGSSGTSSTASPASPASVVATPER
jgi:hypothetical protein